MKIVGLVTEYNPFHYGHKLHLDKSMRLSGATHSVCIMSSSFVQRGEPAVVDKWTRARMAVEGGVDLVLELPFLYAAQSAELFSYGAVRILDSTKVVTHLAFGSEEGEAEPLSVIADLLVKEPKEFQSILKKELSTGFSYPVARSKAVSAYLASEKNILGVISKPNNILGIEYLKALKRLESSIEPVTFKRNGHGYNDSSVTNGIASATGIRNQLFNNGLDSIANLVPKESYDLLCEFQSVHGKFNNLNNFSQLFKYSLLVRSHNEISDFFDIEPGLENRLKRLSLESVSAEELVKSVASKRYPSSRIRRILIHIVSNLKKDLVYQSIEKHPEYIRVLASNSKGFEIINQIKERSKLAVITKFSDSPVGISKVSYDMLDKEVLATNLFYLGLDNSKAFQNLDFTKSPYIKK